LAVLDLVNKNFKWIIRRANAQDFIENYSPNKKNNYLKLPSLSFIGNNFLGTLNLFQLLYPLYQKQGKTFYSDFFYPQNSLRDPRKFCKDNKLVEIQFSIPMKNINGFYELMEFIAKYYKPISCSVKILGTSEKYNNLSFFQKGLSINFDYPYIKNNEKTFNNFVKILLRHEGKINLSKDSLLNEYQFKEMYPEFKIWKKVVKKIDPYNYFQSEMSYRLNIK